MDVVTGNVHFCYFWIRLSLWTNFTSVQPSLGISLFFSVQGNSYVKGKIIFAILYFWWQVVNNTKYSVFMYATNTQLSRWHFHMMYAWNKQYYLHRVRWRDIISGLVRLMIWLTYAKLILGNYIFQDNFSLLRQSNIAGTEECLRRWIHRRIQTSIFIYRLFKTKATGWL